jgi:hypothetical protein
MKALIDATVLSSYSFSEYFDELAGKRVPLAEAIAEKRDVIKNMEKTLQQIDDFIDGKKLESATSDPNRKGLESATPNPKYRDTKLDDEFDRILGKPAPTATP